MRSKRQVSGMICFVLLVMLFSGLATVQTATAQTEEAPTADWKFHSIVDAEFVQQYAKVPMNPKVMIIDARPKRAKYDRGHIPMAVSIPHSKFDKMIDKLPAEKDVVLIYYCGGVTCKLSHESARKAEKLGYTNVRVFAEGYPAWLKVAGNYPSVSEVWVKKQIDKNAEMVLIDSRPKRKKYDKGHISGAVSIPDSQFKKLTDQLPEDKGTLLVFYCGGLKCKLSHKSAAKAIALGYTNVKVFSAGYPAWKALTGEQSAKPSATLTIKSGEEEGSIDIETFKSIMALNPESLLLIDVRDADEFVTGTLKTAVNIPVDALEEKIKTLPTDRPIVFICGTGARSGESFYMVQDLRPQLKNVYYVDAEMTVNADGSFTLKRPA